MDTTPKNLLVSNLSVIPGKYRPESLLGMILFLVFCIGQPAGAQQSIAQPDSSVVQQNTAKADSSIPYRKIETFSKKSRFAGYMYSLLFRPVAATSFTKRTSTLLHLPYGNFEGKVIRNIDIVTLDPFGCSVIDTAIIRQNIGARIGNALHIKTLNFTIKNTLLVHKNSLFDSLLVKESERLIRNLDYVREVLFYVVPAGTTTDSVDMYVRVSDKWSIIPDVAFSTTRITTGLTENNFAGFGHDFRGTYTRNHADEKRMFSTDYSIPNIRNSYIRATLHYDIGEDADFNRRLAVERPFYSPLARWAAGLNLAQVFHEDTSADTVPDQVRQNLKYDIQDYWAGTALKMSKGNTEDERSTKAILAARYLRIRYPERPDKMHDPSGIYFDEDFNLFGIGISALNYFQDNYLFSFGVIEDVPVGKLYGITGGYQMRDTVGRLYLGGRVSSGDYHNWGYLSSTFEYGTFVHGQSLEQSVFAASANYFSHLLKIGNWRIRQFAKPQVTWGMNRFWCDSLTINNEYGIRGFNSSLRGTGKLLLTFQTQAYAPWNVLGFRFGPYLNISLGMLGNTTSGFGKSPVYSQIGLGALIKNDYLVWSNLQLSIAYYPSVPGTGYDIIKINAFSTTDFGFNNFSFGKPAIVPFQ